jgi:N-acetyl-gamma-glutamyl-phosphate reductase
MAAKVFIDGEAGTTGLQIRERLAGRTDIALLSVDADKRKDPAERKRLLNEADVAILCLPDDAAKESVTLIDNGTTRIIDASTAHRVNPDWAYGFAEMSATQADAIANARYVANPGCWPQGLIALIRPLVEAGLMPADYPVSYSGVSGYTGGGKSMIADYEGKGDSASELAPYGLGFNHKHLPEMQAYSGLSVSPIFLPAVGNFAQGMLTQIPLHTDRLPGSPSGKTLHAAIADYFATIGAPFVTVAPFESIERSPDLDPERYNGTNRLALHVFANDTRRQAVLMAVYDNLGKGASGAAVQNLNLMIGADPTTGL